MFIIPISRMLLQKYEPKSPGEFAGNRQQLSEILRWIKSWKKGEGLVIYGPSGTGKTTAVRLAAKELGFEIIERHASDPAELVKESLLGASRQRSLFSKGKIFLIDDAEQLDSGRHVIELIRESDFPVVLIAGKYDKKLSSILSYCKTVRFHRIRYDQIESFLREMCRAEKIQFEEKALGRIAKTCNGDMRAAIIDIETLGHGITDKAAASLGYREKEENIFDTLKIIFRAGSIENASIAAENSGEPDAIIPWLEENIPNEYEKAEEVAEAYDWLSKADIFYSRILRRQSWGLQKYYFGLSVFGVALSKKKAYAKFVRYAFPRRMKGKQEKIPEELASALHVSKKRLRLYSGLLNALSGKKRAR